MLDTTSELAAKLLNTGVSDTDPVDQMKAFLDTSPSNSDIVSKLKTVKAEHKLDDKDTARIAILSLFNADIFKQLKTSKLEVVKQV